MEGAADVLPDSLACCAVYQISSQDVTPSTKKKRHHVSCIFELSRVEHTEEAAGGSAAEGGVPGGGEGAGAAAGSGSGGWTSRQIGV